MILWSETIQNTKKFYAWSYVFPTELAALYYIKSILNEYRFKGDISSILKEMVDKEYRHDDYV